MASNKTKYCGSSDENKMKLNKIEGPLTRSKRKEICRASDRLKKLKNDFGKRPIGLVRRTVEMVPEKLDYGNPKQKLLFMTSLGLIPNTKKNHAPYIKLKRMSPDLVKVFKCRLEKLNPEIQEKRNNLKSLDEPKRPENEIQIQQNSIQKSIIKTGQSQMQKKKSLINMRRRANVPIEQIVKAYQQRMEIFQEYIKNKIEIQSEKQINLNNELVIEEMKEKDDDEIEVIYENVSNIHKNSTIFIQNSTSEASPDKYLSTLSNSINSNNESAKSESFYEIEKNVWINPNTDTMNLLKKNADLIL